MIKMIFNAFMNSEVSFPQEPYLQYLNNLAAHKVVGDEMTLIKYSNNFNNLSNM